MYTKGTRSAREVAAPHAVAELPGAVQLAAQHVEVLRLERLGVAAGLRHALSLQRAPVDRRVAGNAQLVLGYRLRHAAIARLPLRALLPVPDRGAARDRRRIRRQ